MAGKKGIIPTHVKKKFFSHPNIQHPVIQILEEIEDSRKPSYFFQYSLTSVLFMTLIATICGAKDWAQIVIMSQGMTDWLSNYIDMTNGVPCERTFKNIFNSVKPDTMENALLDLSKLLRKKIRGDVVSFDGQTERGTINKHANLAGIHLLNAWSSDNELCLGQLKVDDKSNEITAVPKLMESLDLKGSVITADALNTQKTINAKAIECGADYLLPVKGNQPTLLQEVTSAFEQLDIELAKAQELWERAISKAKETRDRVRSKKLLDEGPSMCGASFWETAEKGHGRIEIRSCVAISANDLPCKSEWVELNTIVRICRERKEGSKVNREISYYITSLPPEAERIANVARRHWGVENKLHWRLDVIFRQDNSRYRDRIGARNMAAIRKMALNALVKDTSVKRGVGTKQCAAACNPTYREIILKNLF
jgi:predicted transposase YbfD/YdcC